MKLLLDCGDGRLVKVNEGGDPRKHNRHKEHDGKYRPAFHVLKQIGQEDKHKPRTALVLSLIHILAAMQSSTATLILQDSRMAAICSGVFIISLDGTMCP